jgi:hypothetical protein
MRLATRCRQLFALVLLGSLAAASCVTPDTGPIPSYQATLAPDAPRTFILFGDSRRTMGSEYWRGSYDRERLAVIEALAQEKPAFIVNTGDLVRAGSDRAEWRTFHAENEPIFSRHIPYYPGVGNHEYLWNPAEGLENLFTSFPGLERRTWYLIRFPPAAVLVLNSNLEDLGPDQTQAQDRWLSDTLAELEKDGAIRHAILAFHHAPFTNCVVHGDSRSAQEHFLTRLTPKVCAVVTGHVHSYERFLVGGVQYLVSGGGGAPLMPIRLERARHADLYRGRSYRPAHYCRFTLDGGRLVCDVIMLQDRKWSRVDGFECP